MKAGWEVKPLGDFAEIRYGYTAKANIEKVGPHFLRITDIQNGSVDWGKVPYCEINEKDCGKFSLSVGDIVFARTGATTGKSFQIKEETDAVFASYLIRVRATRQDLDDRFLSLFFQTSEYWDAVELGTEGAAQGGFNASKLAELKIPLPPLEEQKRIVAVLDAAFEGLTRARTHIETNLQNARELFESYIETAFLEYGENSQVPLEELTEIVSGQSFLSGDFNTSNPVKSIKITNVGIREFVEDDRARLPQNHSSEFSKFCVPSGSIVIALTRSIIAGGLKVAIVPDSFNGALLNQRVAALKCSENMALRDYLFLFMCSSVVVKYVQKSANTLMQPNFSIVDLRRLLVPILTNDQQAKFVELSNHMADQASQMQTHYRVKLQDLDDLRQSLLQKAFAGELT